MLLNIHRKLLETKNINYAPFKIITLDGIFVEDFNTISV